MRAISGLKGPVVPMSPELLELNDIRVVFFY